MTLALCQNTCADKGFSVAGLEYGSECYCEFFHVQDNNTMELTGRTPPSLLQAELPSLTVWAVPYLIANVP